MFQWISKCEKAFEDLKCVFTTALILAHYDSKLETWVETNASNFVVAEVLSQMHGDRVLKPIVYFSKKMIPAEWNYMIYDKELLAIVKSFETWRLELASVNEPVKMLTNHWNLEHFMTTKQLNCWQARWNEFLSDFNFEITYRPGKKGEKPDTLIKLSQDKLKSVDDSRSQQQFQRLLKANQLDDNVKKAIAVVFCGNTATANKTDNKVDEMDGMDEVDAGSEVEENEDIMDVKDYMSLDLHQHLNLQQNLELSFSTTKYGSRIQNPLDDRLKHAYQVDKAVNSIIAATQTSF